MLLHTFNFVRDLGRIKCKVPEDPLGQICMLLSHPWHLNPLSKMFRMQAASNGEDALLAAKLEDLMRFVAEITTTDSKGSASGNANSNPGGGAGGGGRWSKTGKRERGFLS